jgi:WD40 repeat protein
MILREIFQEKQQDDSRRASQQNTRSSVGQIFDKVSNIFGTSAGAMMGLAPRQQAPHEMLSMVGVLKPSLKGTKVMKQSRRDNINQSNDHTELRPVQELQDSESAVTCICFGQERLHRAYILLAAASKDGTVVIYRCYRTEMELLLLSDCDFPKESATDAMNEANEHNSNIAVHSRLVGHSRAITSIFFNLLEDQLVTTSIDKSVRFWSVETGEMLKVRLVR